MADTLGVAPGFEVIAAVGFPVFVQSLAAPASVTLWERPGLRLTWGTLIGFRVGVNCGITKIQVRRLHPTSQGPT